MGLIADAVASGDDPLERADVGVFTNKVDDILDELDDADRAIVLGWLRRTVALGCPRSASMSDELVEGELRKHGIRCSDTTIRRWRNAQADGWGRVWDA